MPNKTEAQLQHDVIVWFSQEYPDFRGLLFEVNNDTYNRNHAMKRRSLGMIKGVSDLVFIIPSNGHVAGIELKAPGTTHQMDHVKNQVSWGKTLIDNDGYFIISSSKEDVKYFITSLIEGDFHAAETIQNGWIKYVDEKDGKTITF